MLRRSLGVSETAPTDSTVKPAPPVDPELPADVHEEFSTEAPKNEQPGVVLPEHMKDNVSCTIFRIHNVSLMPGEN